jgi:DNA-binding NarL/FixJ family response regulator
MPPVTPAIAARCDVAQPDADCRCAALVVDRHPLYRAGLIWALAPLRIRLREAGTLAAALDALEHERAGLILVEWHLPDSGACKGLAAIRQRAPEAAVIVISAGDDEAIDVAARSMGAVDRITKADEPARVRAIVSRVLRCDGSDTTPVGKVDTTPSAATIELTQRQRDVLRQMASGQPNKRIASALGIADSTVRAHVSDILRLMRVRNRTEAVVRAHHEHVLALGGR